MIIQSRNCKTTGTPIDLTQSNLSVSNFDVLGTKDTNAALAMLLDSVKKTPDQNYKQVNITVENNSQIFYYIILLLLLLLL